MAKAKYKKNSRGEFETKVWDGTYNPDGSKHRKRLVSKKSSADLEKQVIALKNSVENGSFVQQTDILFLDYAKHWLSTKKSVKSENTQAMYENIINVHLAFLEYTKLSDIRNSHFQQAINYALDKPRTCQQIYITFKQVINMAVLDNHIGKGMAELICADINLPKYVPGEKRTLTSIEKAALDKAELTDRERAFITLIQYCGIRRGEALALTVFDFSFGSNGNYLNINKALIFRQNEALIKDMPKTEHGFRKIPIPNVAVSFLKQYVGACNGQLFTNRAGNLITKSSYRKMWESIINKLNAAAGGTESFPVITDLTAHIFRHHYCTELCYKIPAISIKKIAYLMGDTEKMVLEVYNHIQEEKENPADVLEEVFCGQNADIDAKKVACGHDADI